MDFIEILRYLFIYEITTVVSIPIKYSLNLKNPSNHVNTVSLVIVLVYP